MRVHALRALRCLLQLVQVQRGAVPHLRGTEAGGEGGAGVSSAAGAAGAGQQAPALREACCWPRQHHIAAAPSLWPASDDTPFPPGPALASSSLSYRARLMSMRMRSRRSGQCAPKRASEDSAAARTVAFSRITRL